MPPLAGKGKSKGREARRSRSRNTTPSSVLSGPLASTSPLTTAYLGIDVSKLLVPSYVAYSDILDRQGGGGGIPDPKHLETLVADLKSLSQLAETRGQACDAAMRELSQRRKELLEEQREKEKADREAEEVREKMRREAEDDDDEIRGRKIGKLKKRKDRSSVRDERPPAHGAHGTTRQDGLDVPMEGTFLHPTLFIAHVHKW
jgi:transcriptional adapter 3